MNQIFVDMDGVLTDFKGAAAKIRPDLLEEHPRNYWPIIKRLGPAFWAEMDWMPDGQELWAYIRSVSVPWILTAKPRGQAGASSVVGKRMWVRKHLGAAFTSRTIVCFRREKKLWAGRQNILIDDKAVTIQDWREVGGLAVFHTRATETIAQLKTIRKRR